MEKSVLCAVTGAFGYSGKYITRRLLSQGKRVLTLTGHPDRPNPFGDRVKVVPFNFAKPAELAQSLAGVDTLFNTYWIRFAYGSLDHDRAVENTKILIRAAEEAGVWRIVHISISHAAATSPLPYFRGKGLVEEAIRGSKLSYAILRPCVIFGAEDVLLNNIAWLLRRFPVFAIPGSGEYKLQPVFVEDLAALAVEAASREDNLIRDAVGPEVYTFDQLVRLIAKGVGSRARILHLRSGLALALAQILSHFVGDVILTGDEVEGLRRNLLLSEGRPTGQTSFANWLAQNADKLGAAYASELSRHYR